MGKKEKREETKKEKEKKMKKMRFLFCWPFFLQFTGYCYVVFIFKSHCLI